MDPRSVFRIVNMPLRPHVTETVTKNRFRKILPGFKTNKTKSVHLSSA